MHKNVIGFIVALAVFAAPALSGDEAVASSSSEAGEIQVLHNASFQQPGEQGEVPELWEGPVLLEGETDPSLAELALRSEIDEAHGEFAAYLRYGSTAAVGWAGLAYEQTEQTFDQTVGAQELTLVYRIRYQYSSGVDHISGHAGLVEVALRSDAGTYRLRYLHLRDGDLPQSSESTAYVDAGDPGFRSWASYEHNLTQDISQAFPELEQYHVSAVRIGILAQRESAEETRLYWLFDHVQLSADGA